MASQFKREYKNLNANEIFNLSLENDSQKFEIAAIFKRGEKVNVNISLGAKVSELEMSFANPVHNFTWHFIKQCGVEKSGERKLLLDGKVYPVLNLVKWCSCGSRHDGIYTVTSWREPQAHHLTRFTLTSETAYGCRKWKTAKAVLLLFRQLRTIFALQIDTMIIDTEILRPFRVSTFLINKIGSASCKTLQIKGRDNSYGTLTFILNQIRVEKQLVLPHKLADTKHLDFQKIWSIPKTVTLFKTFPFSSFNQIGPHSKVTVDKLNVHQLNSLLFYWIQGRNCSIETFELKIKNFVWSKIIDIFRMFQLESPNGDITSGRDILVTEKLLKLSMEGSTFKREDGAIGTVFFSPNIPKSDYGHTLTLHVEYPNSPGLEAKLQALLPIQQQNVERLELLSKDSSEADIAIKKRPLRDSNFWIKSKISKARINKNQCEIERLTREIEHTMFLLNMTQDEEKRRGFGYFFYG